MVLWLRKLLKRKRLCLLISLKEKQICESFLNLLSKLYLIITHCLIIYLISHNKATPRRVQCRGL
jgi:hypothetical protein